MRIPCLEASRARIRSVTSKGKTLVEKRKQRKSSVVSISEDIELSTSRKRVGVPGGRQLDTHYVVKELCCNFRGSAIQIALTSGTTYMHVLFYVLFIPLASEVLTYVDMNATATDAYSMDVTALLAEELIDNQVVSALTFLVTFSLARYLGFLFGRYNERFNNCCKTNGHMTLISLVAAAAMPGCKHEVRLLLRWSNLVLHMYYMMLNGKIGPAEFDKLRQRGLVTLEEQNALETVEKKGSQVYTWALRLVYRLEEQDKLTTFQANEIKGHLSGVRGLAAKQIAYHNTPLPIPYFHFMMWSIHGYLVVMEWNSAVRVSICVHSNIKVWRPVLFECLGAMFVIVAFNTLRRIAVLMINPYGNDVIDYELDFDLRNLWKESLETIDLMGDGVSAEPDLADRMLAKNGVTPNAQHVQVAGTGTEASVDTPAAMDLKGGKDDGHEEGRT